MGCQHATTGRRSVDLADRFPPARENDVHRLDSGRWETDVAAYDPVVTEGGCNPPRGEVAGSSPTPASTVLLGSVRGDMSGESNLHMSWYYHTVAFPPQSFPRPSLYVSPL